MLFGCLIQIEEEEDMLEMVEEDILEALSDVR